MYSFDSRVRFSEVNEAGELSLVAMINYLQDCAGFHGEDAGYGVKWTKETGMTWVLTSIQVHVIRYPRYGERIRIETWAIDFKKCFGYRQYAIRDEEGRILVMGNANWVYMDLKAGRPVSVSEEQQDAYGKDAGLAFEYDFNNKKIRRPKDGERRKSFFITEDKLDTNHHVNNVQYVRMAEKYLPADFVTGNMRAEFRAQARLDDEIIPSVTEKDGVFTVVLESPEKDLYFIGEFSR